MGGNGGVHMPDWSHCLQLMSSMAEKPFFGGRDHHHHNHQQQHPHQLHPAMIAASMNGGPYHHHRVGGMSESSIPPDYMREAWFNNHREKYINVLPNNQQHHSQLNYGLLPETSLAHSVQMIQQSNLLKNDSVNLLKNDNVGSLEEENCEERDAGGLVKKRGGGKAPKSPKAKKPKRAPRAPREECSRLVHRARAPKRSAEVIINGITMDISGIPIPVCTCTGNLQQCYRWGAGGWQSACCTTGMSMYPLPMSAKRRGARIAGRKMSLGAFRKVLEKLASEGYNFSNPIDLRNHWAKHGTNKFVTIR